MKRFAPLLAVVLIGCAATPAPADTVAQVAGGGVILAVRAERGTYVEDEEIVVGATLRSATNDPVSLAGSGPRGTDDATLAGETERGARHGYDSRPASKSDGPEGA